MVLCLLPASFDTFQGESENNPSLSPAFSALSRECVLQETSSSDVKPGSSCQHQHKLFARSLACCPQIPDTAAPL